MIRLAARLSVRSTPTFRPAVWPSALVVRLCTSTTVTPAELLVPGMLPNTAQLAADLLCGSRIALSKSITLIESSRQDHQEQAALLLNATLQRRKENFDTFRLGIAGPPGAGKSTFIEALGMMLVEQGKRVAVIAVDPSSSRTGGSILGDKTRMADLSRHELAFVRPSPTRGVLGGVAEHTNEVILLCEAAGYDTVLIESVGLGQSEVEMDSVCDMLMLLVPPAGGDELQAVKKGIMELVDIVVVNKADGELLGPAQHAVGDFRRALGLVRPKVPEWTPKVRHCSAKNKSGIDVVWEVVQEFRETMAGGAMADKRHIQSEKWMWNQVQAKLVNALKNSEAVQACASSVRADLRQGRLPPRQAAKQVFEAFCQDLLKELQQRPAQ